MMPGADRDLPLVQYGGDVVGMHPLHRKAQDTRRILRPEHPHAVECRHRRARLAHQRRLMGMDALQPDTLDVIDRRMQPDDARSEEHTSELQSLMRISYAVF